MNDYEDFFMINYKITYLPKKKWKGYNLSIEYMTQNYYDVSIHHTSQKIQIEIEKKTFDKPIKHTQEEYDFPDNLYASWWKNAKAYGVLKENELIAAIEICPETWSNRLMITELWVESHYRKQGIGTALINFVKKQAIKKNYRAIILETQSCNTTAIEFYLKQEFVLFGFDRSCYHNDDMNRKEVRLNFGWFNSHFK